MDTELEICYNRSSKQTSLYGKKERKRIMLEFLFTLLLLAIDIVLVLFAIWILLKASLLVAIIAFCVCLVGVPAWWVFAIALAFTIGKSIWAYRSR